MMDVLVRQGYEEQSGESTEKASMQSHNGKR